MGLDPFYALHTWIWNSNPSGMFASYNPTVSCPWKTASGRLKA